MREALGLARAIKSYDEIIGHKNVITWLKRIVEKDSVPNVMIFHGNPGLGKSSLAKLLAIDTALRYEAGSMREKYIESVIGKHQSTDAIRLFNMSEIQEKEEEIQKVKAEMSLGFSKTGRKVLLLDEAHNMSNKAQDAILTDLEHLQEGVYIFICTTEIGSLRNALVSRSKATIQLNDLSEVECRKLIRAEIAARQLSFDISSEMVFAFIASWADNQPRKVLNLLDNFSPGSFVTSNELEVFINTGNAANVIELVKYLYGSMPLGIEFIESLRIDRSFVDMLIEVAKVALGGSAASLSAQDAAYIRKFMMGKDVQHLLQFTVEVSALDSLYKRRVVSAFLRANVGYARGVPPESGRAEESKQEDMAVMMDSIQKPGMDLYIPASERVESLEEMFEKAEPAKI